MNTEVVQETPVLPTRTRKRATARNYHCALHEAGASRLTDNELEIVTKALVILENKVLTQRKTFSSPSLFKAWATLQYGFLEREVFGLVFVDKRHRYIAHQQLFTGTLDLSLIHICRALAMRSPSLCSPMPCTSSMMRKTGRLARAIRLPRSQSILK